jgi:hypothetical protein
MKYNAMKQNIANSFNTAKDYAIMKQFQIGNFFDGINKKKLAKNTAASVPLVFGGASTLLGQSEPVQKAEYFSVENKDQSISDYVSKFLNCRGKEQQEACTQKIIELNHGLRVQGIYDIKGKEDKKGWILYDKRIFASPIIEVKKEKSTVLRFDFDQTPEKVAYLILNNQIIKSGYRNSKGSYEPFMKEEWRIKKSVKDTAKEKGWKFEFKESELDLDAKVEQLENGDYKVSFGHKEGQAILVKYICGGHGLKTKDTTIEGDRKVFTLDDACVNNSSYSIFAFARENNVAVGKQIVDLPYIPSKTLDTGEILSNWTFGVKTGAFASESNEDEQLQGITGNYIELGVEFKFFDSQHFDLSAVIRGIKFFDSYENFNSEDATGFKKTDIETRKGTGIRVRDPDSIATYHEYMGGQTTTVDKKTLENLIDLGINMVISDNFLVGISYGNLKGKTTRSKVVKDQTNVYLGDELINEMPTINPSTETTEENIPTYSTRVGVLAFDMDIILEGLFPQEKDEKDDEGIEKSKIGVIYKLGIGFNF